MGSDSSMKGALFLLEVEIDSVFTVLAAMRTTTMTVNNETVDVTSKGDLQRELLENCGIQSVSIKAQGCISSADSYKKISYAANTGEILNVKINSNNGETYSGGFILSAFETSGEYNKEGLYSITLESADSFSRVDFMLLELGDFLLLEDGSRLVLEAA
jgi:predicted secreted protein